MSKKIFVLGAVIIGALVSVGSANALVSRIGSNIVGVTSCEQQGADIRIKNFGQTYTLTSSCRNAGHGNRQYTMVCTSPTKYRVSWTEGCTPKSVPTPVPVPAPTPTPVYSKSPTVNIWVPYASEAGKREVSASANGCIAGEYITKVQIYENNSLVKTCNNVSACSYLMTNNTYQTVARDVFAQAYCSGNSVIGGHSNVLNVGVSPLYQNNTTVVSSSARLFMQDGVQYVELSATAHGNSNISSMEIYWGKASNKSQSKLIKKCFANNISTYTCTFTYPTMLSHGGFWWAKAWYNNSNYSTETDLNYYNF